MIIAFKDIVCKDIYAKALYAKTLYAKTLYDKTTQQEINMLLYEQACLLMLTSAQTTKLIDPNKKQEVPLTRIAKSPRARTCSVPFEDGFGRRGPAAPVGVVWRRRLAMSIVLETQTHSRRRRS